MSRLPSSRGSNPSGSTPVRRPGGVLVQSPRSDIYVVLLSVALGAIVISVLILVRIFASYGFSTKVSSRPPAPSSVVSLA